MPSLHVLFGLLYLSSLSLLSGLHGANSGSTDTSIQHVGENCDHHTTTTSQFEEYFDIDQIGNNRSEQNVVELTLFVQVHNMQEELAILLSASNRSRQHPDYGQTYELRVSNVYTVIYRETLRMSAHHSHNFNFFPGEQFRLCILITRSGHITVTIPGLQKSLILVVEDERTPIEVAYISFGSRMNAYPVTIYFNCVSSAEGRARQRRPSPSKAITIHAEDEQQRHQLQDADNDRPTAGGRNHDHHEDTNNDDDNDDDDGDDNDSDDVGRGNTHHTAGSEPVDGDSGRQRQTNTGGDDGAQSGAQGTAAASCPVCPRPEKCEVVVKACSDTSKDLLMQPTSGSDGEKQKYFFYFNVYLSRKGEKGKTTAADLTPALGTANQVL
ncbi:AGAP000267-PA-like protein [Anopheles sinensis]|uniref:AGAP000267-PA-like protein n=1 Tax=Anopheles sinensis TaxID=74873 RepID=A0A084VX77_ANOSI|nr:AGAP000267-PA-like protein [Anopheles sinensis]